MGRHQGHIKAGGRKRGTGNKNNEPIREAIQLILDDNMDKLKEEFRKLKGLQFIDRMLQLLEYRLPKLNRVDLTNDGEQFDFSGFNDNELINELSRFTKFIESVQN